MMGRAVPASLVACTSLLLLSCAAETFPVTPRAPGDRTPLTAACSPFDDERCLVPWPSNSFTVADATTATGLRVHADVSSINRMDMGASRLSWADGFSRVTSVVASFEGDLDAASFGGPRGGAMRLFVATPGDHAADEGLVLSAAVGVRGVEERDADVQRAQQRGRGAQTKQGARALA